MARCPTLVTVLGYVLFLGLLTATLTQWLGETIRKLESGLVPAREIETPYTSPGALQELQLESYDSIVLLASERLSHEDEAEASSVLGHLMLRRLIDPDREKPHVLVELLDEASRDLFTRNRDDFIVSSTVVSYLLSQVALRPELAVLYTELFRPLGAKIELFRATQYLPEPDHRVRFADLAQAAEARGETALGLRRYSEGAVQVILNPDRSRSWTLSARDEVVVLASRSERERQMNPRRAVLPQPGR